MAKPRKRPGSPYGAGQGQQPGWWEWLEQHAGAAGVGVTVAGWVVLFVLTAAGTWPLEVTFFVAAGWLTFVLGCLSLFAALAEARHAKPSNVLRLPDSWKDVEEYVRWLTPMAFVFGLVFAHYYWH